MTARFVEDPFVLMVGPVSEDQNYAFGVPRKDLAENLRDLAARIEDGRALPQNMKLSHDIVLDDFATKTLTIIFAEKIS